jgi:aminoglycoside phosphotransferase (APT) family kinase protein
MNIDKASKVREGEELNIAFLNKYLKKDIVDFEEITEVAQFPGGFSNLTYLIKAGEKEYVLRRPPFGASAKGGHDMGREFRVLSSLKNAHYNKIPTPLSIGVLTDSMEASGEVLGAPFYVMQRLQGVILRAKDATNPALTPSVIALLCEKLIDNLADLHNLDIDSTGLAQLGKPEGYVQRQVEGWIQRYAQSKTDEMPNMETIAEWMMQYKPIEQKTAFLHNDYKFDNVVWNEGLTDIIGVLDWEMSTVGDPLMDLGAALAYWCEADEPQFSKLFNLTWINGALTRKEIVKIYADKTGRNVQDIVFYYVFGLYKNAVIMQQIYTRWKKGLTQDTRFGALIQGVHELSNMAVKAINTNTI